MTLSTPSPSTAIASPRIGEEVEGPGLVDLQLNGYIGFDFNGPAETWTADQLHRIRVRLRQRGVVAVLPTFITDDQDAVVARAAAYGRLVAADPELAATFPGLHIEGPFLSPDEGPRGAHPKEFCVAPADSPYFLDRLIDASGDRVRLLTLAPELVGGAAFIRYAIRCGVLVAIGHTALTPDNLEAAVASGARMCTHLGNGSHQTLPRLDNYVQWQLADDRLHASFIADGHHIPFATLKNMIRAKEWQRSILVTDAVAAADVGPGRYPLGAGEVIVTESMRVYRPGQANLAGSAITLDRCVLNVWRHCAVPFEQAWAMASEIPARLLGLEDLPTVRVVIQEDGFRCCDP